MLEQHVEVVEEEVGKKARSGITINKLFRDFQLPGTV